MNLTLKDYKRILSSSTSMEEKHRRLIGNSCNERDIADCGVSYVSNLLKADMGRSEPYVFSEIILYLNKKLSVIKIIH